MLQSLGKSVVLSRAPVGAIASALSLTTFGWFLVQDLVHPMVIFLLQLYLTF